MKHRAHQASGQGRKTAKVVAVAAVGSVALSSAVAAQATTVGCAIDRYPAEIGTCGRHPQGASQASANASADHRNISNGRIVEVNLSAGSCGGVILVDDDNQIVESLNDCDIDGEPEELYVSFSADDDIVGTYMNVVDGSSTATEIAWCTGCTLPTNNNSSSGNDVYVSTNDSSGALKAWLYFDTNHSAGTFTLYLTTNNADANAQAGPSYYVNSSGPLVDEGSAFENMVDYFFVYPD